MGVRGGLLPALSLTLGSSVRINFGTAAFTYQPPSSEYEGVAMASFATDGIDGASDAAGAIATGQTCARARELGLDPQEYLNNNDSNSFFEQVGGLIRTGPTGTNVNDIAFLLAY